MYLNKHLHNHNFIKFYKNLFQTLCEILEFNIHII